MTLKTDWAARMIIAAAAALLVTTSLGCGDEFQPDDNATPGATTPGATTPPAGPGPGTPGGPSQRTVPQIVEEFRAARLAWAVSFCSCYFTSTPAEYDECLNEKRTEVLPPYETLGDIEGYKETYACYVDEIAQELDCLKESLVGFQSCVSNSCPATQEALDTCLEVHYFSARCSTYIASSEALNMDSKAFDYVLDRWTCDR